MLSRKTCSWWGTCRPVPSAALFLMTCASSSCSMMLRGANVLRRSATQPVGTEESLTDSEIMYCLEGT